MRPVKALIFYDKQSSAVILGMCIGIAISLVLTPFLDEDCTGTTNSAEDATTVSWSLVADDLEDYEPRILLDPESSRKNQNGVKEKQRLIRPRYYSTELGIKDKLLAAVLTTQKTVQSLAVAINKTLSHNVNKLLFFLDGSVPKHLDSELNIPIVSFRAVKPLLKVFQVISYLSENHKSSYDYYLIVTDSTYVHGRKLMNMVNRISVSEAVYMGAVAHRKGSPYCELESGIIMSSIVLEKVSSQLNWCIQNLNSTSHSDCVGRCIVHSTNLPCQTSMQGQSFPSYHLKEGINIPAHLQLPHQSSPMHGCVTVTGASDAKDIYALHRYFLQEDLNEIERDIEESRQRVKKAKPFAPHEKWKDTWPVGSAPSHTPATRFDVIRWDTFNATHLFHPDDFCNTKLLMGADLLDIMDVVNSSISHLLAIDKRHLNYLKLEYGHRRIDPTRGADYILSLKFHDTTAGRIISKKVQASRALTKPEILPVPYVTENSKITVIIPVTQWDISDAVDFIKRFVPDNNSGQITMLLVLLCETRNTEATSKFKRLKEKSLTFTQMHQHMGVRMGWVTVSTMEKYPSDFTIFDLMIKKLPSSTLLLLLHPLVVINSDFLNRVRMNTILNWQVFSPVPFTYYNPNVIDDLTAYKKLEVNRNVGHFDRYNFNFISFYAADYLAAHKSVERDAATNKNTLNNASGHKLRLYELFLQTPSLRVLRAAEPALKLKYHLVTCDRSDSISQGKFCQLRQGVSLGLRSQLSKLIIEFQEKHKRKLGF